MISVLGKGLKLLFSSSLVAELIDPYWGIKSTPGIGPMKPGGPVQQPYALS